MIEQKPQPKISYSSLTTMMGCPRKFWHYKINKTERDADIIDDAHPLRFGSAFHKILEDVKHGELSPVSGLLGSVQEREQAFKLLNAVTIRACTEQGLEQFDAAKLLRMAKAYVELHLKSGLRVAGVEVRVENDFCLGFVDVVLEHEATGAWWISDIKTKRSLEKTLLQRLPEDPQLLSYAMQRESIAKDCNLDVEKFAGFLYRVAMKPQQKEKKNEKYNEMVARIKDPDVYQIKVPYFKRQEGVVRQMFENGYATYMRMLDKPTIQPTQNFAYCETYNKPCEYWSHCHGVTFSEGADRVEIETQADIKPMTVAKEPPTETLLGVEDLLL